MKDFTEQIIKQVVNAWAAQNKAVTGYFNKYDDSVYLQELAPGRNRAIYVFGHIIAVNDRLLAMLGLGEPLFPQLQETFITEPDRSVANLPSLGELKENWEKLNATLTDHFNAMTAEDWMSRHTSVSPEDFEREPMRNKLNVLISRTNHQCYHIGQLNLLKA